MPQVSVVSGPCAGGAAYSPALGDVTVMAGAGARMFLTGPSVVAKVTREEISAEALGGPRVQGRNGVAHLAADGDVQAAELVRTTLAHLPGPCGRAAPALRPARPGARRPRRRPARAGTARSTTCATSPRGSSTAARCSSSRRAGRATSSSAWPASRARRSASSPTSRATSAAASTPTRRRRARGSSGSATATAIPLVVLVDTPGFLPGLAQEQAGVIRHGAGLLRAFATATTRRVTVTLRQAYGGAHIVMNSRDLGADLTLAWPDAKIGVMGARQAVEVVHRRDLAAGADADALAERLRGRAPARGRGRRGGFVDEVIAPDETRERLAFALEAGR